MKIKLSKTTMLSNLSTSTACTMLVNNSYFHMMYFSFLFISQECTMWPATYNCLPTNSMVCSCVLPHKIFYSYFCVKNGRQLPWAVKEWFKHTNKLVGYWPWLSLNIMISQSLLRSNICFCTWVWQIIDLFTRLQYFLNRYSRIG